MEDSRQWSRVLGDLAAGQVSIGRPGQENLTGTLVDESAQGMAVDLPPATTIEPGEEVTIYAARSARRGTVRYVRREGFAIRVGIAVVASDSGCR